MQVTINQQLIDGKAARLYEVDLSSLVDDLIITSCAEVRSGVKGNLKDLCYEVGGIGNGKEVRATASIRHVACFFVPNTLIQLLEIDRQVLLLLQKYLGQPMVKTYALYMQPVRQG